MVYKHYCIEYTKQEQEGERMTREELPEVLQVKHIKQFMKLGNDKAYDLVASGAFHCVKVGNRFYIPREIFLNWLDGKQKK